jgi:hypothetical protein
VVIVIKLAVCKFKWSITKRSCLKLAVHCGDNGLVKIAKEWLTHSGVWGSNLLVFIEPAQSRKVVHIEEDKIVII